MFILKPIQSSLFSKDDIGTVEEVVRETKLVDKGIEELKRFSRNAPIFEPERRKFLKHAAILAGLYATGHLLKGCATMQWPEIVYPAGSPRIISDYAVDPLHCARVFVDKAGKDLHRGGAVIPNSQRAGLQRV